MSQSGRPPLQHYHRPLTSPPASGEVLWLPKPDPRNIIVERCLNHPAVVLYSLPDGKCWFVLMTSFHGKSIQEKYHGQSDAMKKARVKYLPLAPTLPHPDTGGILNPIITGRPGTGRKSENSYIHLSEPIFAEYWVLAKLSGGEMRLSFEDLNRVRHLAKRYVPCNIRRMLKEAELVERAIPAEDETSTSQSRDNVERSPASTPHSQKTQSDNILSTPARKSDFSEYDPSTPIPETSCGISILDPSVEYRTLIPAGNVYKYPILCVTAGYALWRMKNG